MNESSFSLELYISSVYVAAVWMETVAHSLKALCTLFLSVTVCITTSLFLIIRPSDEMHPFPSSSSSSALLPLYFISDFRAIFVMNKTKKIYIIQEKLQQPACKFIFLSSRLLCIEPKEDHRIHFHRLQKITKISFQDFLYSVFFNFR